MKVLEEKREKNTMFTTFLLEPTDFAMVRKETALDDAVLDSIIAAIYRQYIDSKKIKQVGQPQLTEVSSLEDGNLTFSVRVETYPEIILGQYIGLVLTKSENEEDELDVVMRKAISGLEAEIPEAMIQRKLDAMAAEEKMRINEDPIYNVLSDMIEILGRAYRATGVTRPAAQVRHEAMDVMLQTLSSERNGSKNEFFVRLIKELVTQYRDLPESFEEKIDEIVIEWKNKKEAMSLEERIEKVFLAYLGSLGMTMESWRGDNIDKAVETVKMELLLDAVAEAEGIQASEEEVSKEYIRSAEKWGVDVSQLRKAMEPEMMKWQLRREKAQKLIVESAVYAKGAVL